ncbi:hypothetical protein Ga0074812_1084 [Parafrankia irregularis]|uniref:PKD domain-containing protein n=1 Tax=Parafrankia irregularis TaxID=795642 RepID=A0A0S4QLZ7_9ACTN|nr:MULTISPECIES: ATP/GTP-binding protein [Parafrankia]MBE3205284.1 ATP/GTP-binding protein [Parafrankia sp. CH37]CUU56477.1 hypothetical protein Ga0074812_1084 [Parafrankia irregularis]
MRLRRLVLTGACLLGFLAAGAPAFADSYATTDCAQNPIPGCDLAAGGSGLAPRPPGGQAPLPRSSGGGSSGRSGAAPPGDVALDPADVAHCSYVRSDFQPTAEAVQPVRFRRAPDGGLRVVAAIDRPGPLLARPAATGPDGRSGAWYVYQCQTDGVRDALYRPPVWIPDGQGGPAAGGPDVGGLAEQARSQLRLQGPAIALSPTSRQLIRLPTWMWLDPAGWEPVSATAAAGGVSVTATATPAGVDWSMGDGTQVHCAGPGTPYPAGGDPKASSPDCGHTYQRVSEDQPGGTFPVTVTLTWNVTWAGAGQTGAFDGLTTVSTVQVEVIAIPALITGGG